MPPFWNTAKKRVIAAFNPFHVTYYFFAQKHLALKIFCGNKYGNKSSYPEIQRV
jgi:hypothetical protein